MFNHEPKKYQCPMCLIVNGKFGTLLTKESDIFHQNKILTAFINAEWWINNSGNVIILPNQHYENIYDLPDKLAGEIFIFTKRTAIALKETYNCDGTSVRQHNEPAGNQELWHFHIHVFPRYDNDKLYQLHDQKRWTTPEERKPYAEKLRKYFISKNNSGAI
jgi:histidine triad (HIT) family protein